MARTTPSNAPSRRNPGSWGSTQHLPSGRWRAFYRHEGERITAHSTFETKDAALAWLAGERADRARGVWIDPRAGGITLEEYARTWLDARADLAPRTRDLYLHLLERWLLRPLPTAHGRQLTLAGDELATLSPARVRAWHAAVLHAARESSAARAEARAARHAHPARRWALRQGIEVAPTGRLSPEVLTAWHCAGAPIPPVPASRGALTADQAGRSTAAKAYSLLRVILGTAVTDGQLRDNPCRITGAGQERTPERGTANPAEVAALAAAMPAHLAAAVILAAWSGLRFGELFALARRHVDLENGTLRVERALIRVQGQPLSFGPPKTRRSARLVHVPAFALETLAAHMDTHTAADADALVFHRDGAPVSNSHLSRHFRRAAHVIDRAELHWHDLRHTGATLAYRAGASVPEVQARLGHATMRAALIYAHASDDSDRLIADRLNTMFGEQPETPKLRAV